MKVVHMPAALSKPPFSLDARLSRLRRHFLMRFFSVNSNFVFFAPHLKLTLLLWLLFSLAAFCCRFERFEIMGGEKKTERQ